MSFSCIVFLLFSCSSSDGNSSNSPTVGIKPTRILTTIDYNSPLEFDVSYTYDGNRITETVTIERRVGVTIKTTTATYSYVGDLLDKIVQLNDVDDNIETFTYQFDSSERVTKQTVVNSIEVQRNQITVVAYPSSTTANVKVYSQTISNENLTKDIALNFENGEVISAVWNTRENVTWFESIYNNTFDSRNGALKNISNIRNFVILAGGAGRGINHNISTYNVSTTGSGFENTTIYMTEYNEEDYPTRESISSDGPFRTVEYFY